MRVVFLVMMAVVAVLPTLVQAQNKPAALPVDRVVLSTAGLAHIEHALTIDGAQDVLLSLRLDQIDDVMKSLIVFDTKGSLGGVTLPGRQPLAEAFRDLPFKQNDLDDPVLLLNAYQGAGVTVTVEGRVIKGQLVRVTPEPRVTGDGLQEIRYRLTLMTETGLQRLWLDDAQSLQFDDAAIKTDITNALKAVRENATASQRDLTLSLLGEGRRKVRLAYVVDAPLWKAAYRLVLPAAETEGADAGFLQGWAVVENMTASDWNNVDLTLVSGNPVTFRQQLYQSYYVDRPEVPVEVLGRVMPRVDTGTAGTADRLEASSPRAMMKAAPAMPGAPAPQMLARSGVAMDSFASAEMASADFAGDMENVAVSANAAASAEATTQVLFRFPARVTLAAGQSLMIPFVSQEMSMRRVSVYQPDTHPRHPLAAAEIENKGKSGLPPGVLTLFEENSALQGASYIGDAKLPALAAGEKRLVSYALDSKVIVDRLQASDSRRGKATLSGGVLRIEQTMRETTTYTIKAPAGEARTVIIEHPRRGDFKLVSPKAEAAEVAENHYRLRVSVPAGKEKTLDVVLERTDWETQSIADLSVDQMLAYAAAEGGLDGDVRDVFADLAKTRRSLDGIDAELARLEQERTTIFSDQERLRANLANLSRMGEQSALQERYLKKLAEQENRLATIEDEREKLTTRRTALLTELKEQMAAAED